MHLVSDLVCPHLVHDATSSEMATIASKTPITITQMRPLPMFPMAANVAVDGMDMMVYRIVPGIRTEATETPSIRAPDRAIALCTSNSCCMFTSLSGFI